MLCPLLDAWLTTEELLRDTDDTVENNEISDDDEFLLPSVCIDWVDGRRGGSAGDNWLVDVRLGRGGGNDRSCDSLGGGSGAVGRRGKGGVCFEPDERGGIEGEGGRSDCL